MEIYFNFIGAVMVTAFAVAIIVLVMFMCLCLYKIVRSK